MKPARGWDSPSMSMGKNGQEGKKKMVRKGRKKKGSEKKKRETLEFFGGWFSLGIFRRDL